MSLKNALLHLFTFPSGVCATNRNHDNGNVSQAIEVQPPGLQVAAQANLTASKIKEWTALGDSYAVGVGGGSLLEDRRCLRFASAYPVQMQYGSQMGAMDRRRFINAACSGATTAEMLDWQLLSEPTSQLEYGARPAFGKPQFSTLTFGGDDIDFFGLVNNCIYEYVPFRKCADQLEHSWKLLRSPKFIDSLDKALEKIIKKGRETSGEQFKLYVTSYAKFFNAETNQCSKVTWSMWSGWPGHQTKLTKKLRRELNSMAEELNAGLQEAVKRHKHEGASYISWDEDMEGHRFCEEGITEPDTATDHTWFYQNRREDEDNPEQELSLHDKISKVLDPLVKNAHEFKKKHKNTFKKNPAPATINPDITDTRDLFNALSDEHFIGIFRDDALGSLIRMVRVFHPKPWVHRKIMDKIFDQLAQDGLL